MSKRCSNCGHENRDVATFCGNCGSKLVSPDFSSNLRDNGPSTNGSNSTTTTTTTANTGSASSSDDLGSVCCGVLIILFIIILIMSIG